ncbi:hypothetical protein JCM14202_290 [Agrilactobacillus composti DSM 18527 = JCM 14202]|uniref:hypothetical protein n=1 Tax=Agrilactobacillus composti TaxID=398555 RepID=UPI00042DF4D5|nr:hypothetical protein [Agrilactobacillus composti]GAF38478.1 hypothetical protein JCM14202_290 [Agrilactobacillus composti DSM 18527 = JCM 14202]
MKITTHFRKTAFLVAFLAALGGLLGVGGASQVQAASKVVNISYWHVNAQTQGGAAVDDLVKNFNKTHPNIQVSAKYNPNMYQA